MRYFIPILFLILALFSLQTLLVHPEQDGPGQEATAFLKDIQSGNLTKIVSHFGGNTCRCPVHNGWGAFLAYQPGQEVNLAFLLGHPFITGQPIAKRIKSSPQAKSAAPLELPEDYAVDVPITFSDPKYSPLFLPIPLAYGKTMTWVEVQNFIKDPDRDASKGFSLRLRPSINPGSIKFDTSTIAANVLGEFKFLQPVSLGKNKEKNVNQIVADSLKKSGEQFVTPQDAGIVVMPDGNNLSWQKLTEILPKLKTVTLRLHVVRRGKFQPWTIFHFLLQKPVIESAGKLIPLHN